MNSIKHVFRYIFFFFITTPLISTVDSGNYNLFILGHYHFMEENLEPALTCYQKLFSNTSSPYPLGCFLRFLYATGQYKVIVELLPKIDAHFSDDESTQLILAQALAESGQTRAADERFIALQKKFKRNPEITYLAAQAHSKTNPKKAIEAIDEFLGASPFQPRHCIFYFLQSKLYLQINNKEKAIENVKKSIEICPRFDQGWLFLGMLREQEGKITEAIEGYKKFLELAGPNKEVEQEINALILRSKLAPQTTSQQSGKKTLPCMANAVSFYEKKQYANALQAIDECLKTYPENQEARIFKIHILSAHNAIDSAIQLLKQWIEQDPHNELWFKTLHLLYHAPFHQKIVHTLQEIEKNNPNSLLATLYLADIYTKEKQYTQAITAHKKALTLAQNQTLKTKILFNLGIIYYEKDDLKAMKQALEEGQKYDPKFAPLLNMLAYYYATDGMNIDKAQQLIGTTLALDPHNPHFLDTQALIWIHQQEYKKAESLLKKLVKQEPEDYYIHLHLGLVSEKLGNVEKSSEHLKKAATLARTEKQKKESKKLVCALH